jgi:16S rRNA (guanine966-N2)-methyltransferase
VARRRPAEPAGRSRPARAAGRELPAEGTLRIIGGRLRGRRITYTSQAGTRPMKDRVREAVFNLLGVEVEGKPALDLFAGSGALGLEALSRGAARATFVERHQPTAACIRRNCAELGLENEIEVIATDAFAWVARHAGAVQVPAVAFCSPPWDLFAERADDMLALIRALTERLATGSMIVVEADDRFDPAALPDAAAWDIRRYAPAVIAIRQLGC